MTAVSWHELALTMGVGAVAPDTGAAGGGVAAEAGAASAEAIFITGTFSFCPALMAEVFMSLSASISLTEVLCALAIFASSRRI